VVSPVNVSQSAARTNLAAGNRAATAGRRCARQLRTDSLDGFLGPAPCHQGDMLARDDRLEVADRALYSGLVRRSLWFSCACGIVAARAVYCSSAGAFARYHANAGQGAAMVGGLSITPRVFVRMARGLSLADWLCAQSCLRAGGIVWVGIPIVLHGPPDRV